MTSQPTLLVVICSTRPGRIGKPIGDWFTQQAVADGTFTVRVADLAEVALPFMDEPKHPRLHDYQHEHTKRWSATVRGADAVVWVTPEYNYSMVAPLKNALDYLAIEWAHLPTGFVSYGGVSGGLRSVEMAKSTMVALKMVPTGATVAIPFAGQLIADGGFTPYEATQSAVAPLLAELNTLHGALRDLRAQALTALDS